MANLTATAPGTVAKCPDCGDMVDPYFHCCPWAKNDRPYPQHVPLDQRSDEERERLQNWSDHYTDPVE